MRWTYTAVMVRALVVTLMVVTMVSGGRAVAQESAPAWQVELDRRHDELVKRNGPGTDAALRDQLLAMREADQTARGVEHGRAKNKDQVETAGNLGEIDAGLTVQLKAIVAEKGWPTIAMVGIEASNGAMLVLTHTRDHAWQLSLLEKLEGLADAGKIDGSALAVVIDKELVAEGKLQRYGSQFRVEDGGLAMFGVEDPAGLDKRRAMVFLPPMEVYKQMMAQRYHLKMTNKIVSAAK